MDYELHEELSELKTQLALVVQRTAGLPEAIAKMDERIADLENSRKQVKYTVAGGSAVFSACWAVAYFVLHEIVK